MIINTRYKLMFMGKYVDLENENAYLWIKDDIEITLSM
jgi:hypothetical protein